MRGAIPPLPSTPSWGGSQLRIAQGQLYLTLLTYKLRVYVGRNVTNYYRPEKNNTIWLY
jgi:hypothetical protein